MDLSALECLGQKAKEATYSLSSLSTQEKNAALLHLSATLKENRESILAANLRDLDAAQKKGLSSALLDRLSIQKNRLDAIADDVVKVAALPDPVGVILEEHVLSSGLKLSKKRVPIGVIGMIYEARPNVTIDTIALCLKTGNAAILRGGSETLQTNCALIDVVQSALKKTRIPPDAFQLITDPDRACISHFLKMDHFVDMIIPRGGAALHRLCREQSTIPVITGGIGICHLFMDASARLDPSIEVIVNAKTDRPSVCNALDTLLVHQEISERFLPPLIHRLLALGVTFRLDEKSWALLEPFRKQTPHSFEKACSEDWNTEWMSLILGIKIVNSLEEALQHIRLHSSSHSDGILTESQENALRFVQQVDSAAVYVNTSTRFTDGGQYGLGAEVAISTQKLHARGPMGLAELTTYKWIGQGNYLIRK